MVKFKGSRRALQKPSKIDEFEDEFEDELGKPQVKKWYEDVPDDPKSFKTVLEGDVIQLKDEARVVLENDTLHFKNKSASGKNRSQNDWLQTMITKGTMQDRIAASVVLIQNSPLHSLGTISSLIGQVKTSKKHCVKLMEVLTDLFISYLLLPDQKLRPFEKRPLSLLNDLSNGVLKKRKYFLSLWYFEDQLKIEYRNFIQAILEVGRDTVVSNREKSIIAMQKLLVGNPEQESTLLASLVNKIGDPVPAVASKACRHLKIVLDQHPNMKTVVKEELERLLFRPNISLRAQYYTICFLAHYEFTSDDEELAARFIQLYFAFFKACVKKGNVDSRMMSIILAGVKRAFPFAKKDSLNIKDYVDTLYKIVHIAQFKVALLSLYLLLQISDYDVAISDRFYTNLYQFILHPGLLTSAHHVIFVSLVFQALSKDIQFNRIKVFIKRLLQVCHYAPAPLACGILVMIGHMFRKFPNIKSLALVATEFNEEDDKSDEEHYEDAPFQEEDDEQNMDNKEEVLVKNEDVICEEKPGEKKPLISSWHHVSHTNNGSRSSNKEICRVNVRNPLFLANELNVYTELVSLSSHFHPTVSLFANHLLKDTFIGYSGNPLVDFTLSRFLDRWVFKNPKKINKDNITKFCKSSTYRPHGVRNLPVNSEEYLKVAESSIPSDEVFLYRFLKEQKEGKFIRKKDEDEESEVSSVASEEFEGIMDQLVGGKEVFDFDEGIKAPSESDKKKKKADSDEDSSGSEGEEKDENEDEEEDDDFDSDAEGSDDEKADEHSDIDRDIVRETNTKEDEDDEMDYEKVKEEFSDLDDIDEDEEVMSFDGDSDEDFTFTMSDVETDVVNFKSNTKKSSKESKSNRKNADNSVFAPAEEFAQMLEDTGDLFAKYGSLANMSNKDNAGMKQLKWEMKRNQWIHGQNKGKRKGGGKFSNKLRKKFKK